MNYPPKLYPLEVQYKKMSPQEARVLPWVASKGDNSLRLDYPLKPDSLVYDVGGYHGDWATDISTKYDCYIKVFEPVKMYIDRLETLFADNNKITILPYGLGGSNRNELIGIDNEASSVFKPGQNTEKIQIKDIAEVIKNDLVDLLKTNIEGGEYELLDRLISMKLIGRIKNIQIQFHDFVPDAKKKRSDLQRKLSQTHTLTYNYPFIWENWECND